MVFIINVRLYRLFFTIIDTIYDTMYNERKE